MHNPYTNISNIDQFTENEDELQNWSLEDMLTIVDFPHISKSGTISQFPTNFDIETEKPLEF